MSAAHQFKDILSDEILANRDCLSRIQNYIVENEEKTRTYLAREIHDGPAQSLVNVISRLELIKNLYRHSDNPDEVWQELDELDKTLRRNLNEIRGFIHQLHPVISEGLGIISAINHLIDEISEQVKFELRFDYSGGDLVLAKSVTLNIYRIIQEAINNIRKHARASQAKIYINKIDNYLKIKIIDDGAGFEYSSACQYYRKRMHFGLISMQERCDLIDGELIINSSPGSGTEILLTVPV